MNQDKYILAIDHGTSGAKVALFTTRGEALGFEFEPTPIIFLPGGGAEQDPAEWWRAIVSATRRLLARNLTPAEKIVAVACSSTFASTVAVDSAGKPLMNSLTWMDSRGAPYVKERMEDFLNIMGYSLSNILSFIPRAGGAPALSGKDDAGHILYWKNRLPDIYARTHMFLGSKDYLNLKLTGKIAASPDSIALFWLADIRDINNVRYDDGLVRRIGVDREKLAPLKPSTGILGNLTPEAARDLGLPETVQVIVGSADLQSACVGSGAVRDFEGHIYIGTSSWILCHIPFKKTDVFHIITSLPSAIPGKYFCANEQDAAGGALAFLINNLVYPDDGLNPGPPPDDVYDRADRLASQVPPGANGVIFTPWLNGEKTPVEDHYLRAGFQNLSFQSARKDLVRAVLEGVACNSRWVFGYVEKFVKRKLEPLNIIGGGARLSTWCQIYADVFDRTIRQVQDPLLGNARGAAFLASVALGYIKFDDIPGLVKFTEICRPNPGNRKIYDGLFREFLNLYQNNRRMYKRLNK
ncbi:MAG: FGGY-family carbohydrate kinase [bacterium]|nr:FGGY-family carbohydrate kinase [bacterium]